MASLYNNISGQNLKFGLISTSTGAGVAGLTVTVLVTKDGGAQAAGGGTVTSLGGGQYNYVPTQAETNATEVGFMFSGSGVYAVHLDYFTDNTNVKKNQAQPNFMFVMTDNVNHTPKTGLTVSAVKSLDGAAFISCTNPPTEVGNGTYAINLAAADTNGNRIMYRFTATGADDLNIEIITQP